jgi:hypothetical protein
MRTAAVHLVLCSEFRVNNPRRGNEAEIHFRVSINTNEASNASAPIRQSKEERDAQVKRPVAISGIGWTAAVHLVSC